MLDIKGNKHKLWVDVHEGKNGKFKTYSTSISKKTMDGKYINKSIKLFFSRDIDVPNYLSNGCLISFEGFPTLDVYTAKDGTERREVAIFVTKLDWWESGGDDDEDCFTEAEEEIPF